MRSARMKMSTGAAMTSRSRLFGAAVIAAVLAVPLASTPVSAQPPVLIGGGLVNVQIQTISVEDNEILSDITVQVPINAAVQLAANVCGVSVEALTTELLEENSVECDTTATQRGGEQVVRSVNLTRL